MNTNPTVGRYLLNCFSVEFSVQSVSVAQLPWTKETDIRELRRSLGDDWFVLRRGDKIYGLPIVPKPVVEFGNATTGLPLSSYDGLDFMRARLDAALPNLLPAYQPERVRPFRFLAQKDEFVASFAANHQLPDIVKRGFANVFKASEFEPSVVQNALLERVATESPHARNTEKLAALYGGLSLSIKVRFSTLTPVALQHFSTPIPINTTMKQKILFLAAKR